MPATTATSVSAGPSVINRPLTLVLADDEPPFHEVFNALFQGLPVSLFAARDGEEALDIIAVRHVDGLFADLAMPGTNGYQLIETLRHDPKWIERRDIFIVAMTGHHWLGQRCSAESFGADRYLPKPFGVEDVYAALRAIAEGRAEH
jgi:CheY-like chemotaxis protein